MLDGEQVRSLLAELGRRLDARGVQARLFLVGGAAMALAYSRERVTRDLDAVFEPKRLVYEEATRMASELHLPPNWLNDSVKGVMPDRQPPVEGTASFATTGLYVGVASAEYLFAMKAQAARQETDGADLRLLADRLGIHDIGTALDLVERFYGPQRLRPNTQLILEDLLARPNGHDT